MQKKFFKDFKRFKKILFIVIVVLSLVLLVWFSYVYLAGLGKNPLEKAWSKLKPKAGREAEYYLGVGNTPRLVSGGFSGYEKRKDPVSVAWAFLIDNKNLYQLSDPEKELKVASKEATPNGTNVKFAQYYQDIPVYGAEIIVRVSQELKIDSVFSTYIPSISLSTTPTYPKEKAVKKVGQPDQAKAVIFSPTIYNLSGSPQLAWYIKTEEEDVFVSALDGQVIHSYATVYEARNRNTHAANETPTLPGTLWLDENGAVPGLPAGEPDLDGTNAHDFAGITYNYYHTRLNRDSWNNQGATMVSTVHYRKNPFIPYNNAAWTSGNQLVKYGTNYANALDVVAHEWTHAVTDSEANLDYSGESGALNESFSDIFGTFTQFYSGIKNWTVGEDVQITRDMKNPNLFNQPDDLNDPLFFQINPPCTKDNDYCGVHVNSGILNKVAQLLVDGGYHNGKIIQPLGVEKTERLLYHVLTEKLTNASGFSDMRNETIETAKTGFKTVNNFQYTFSAKEKASIINAFASVSIGAEDANYDGKADDKTPPGKGVVFLEIQTPQTTLNTEACGSPTELTVYALIKVYGNTQSFLQFYPLIQYKIADGDWQISKEVKMEPWQDGGEYSQANWYKFKIKNLTTGGKLAYKLAFYVQEQGQLMAPPDYYLTSQEYSNITVNSCPAQTIANQAGIPQKTLHPEKLGVPSKIISSPNLPKEKQATINSTAEIDGSVNASGRTEEEPKAGEPSGGTRAFLSFDLSQIPAGAKIISANLDLSQAEATGNPFSLGDLLIYNFNFETLDVSDYDTRGTLITKVNSLSETSAVGVSEYIEPKIGSREAKFQIRLQFSSTNNNNRTVDYLTFPSYKASLVIKYEI